MKKAFRQARIRKLIRARPILTQDELAAELAAAEPPRENLRRVLQEFLRDVEVAQNLVVLKTTPGGASAVGLALDAEDWPELVGTVAGDDTLFAATPTDRAARKLQKVLVEIW